MNFVNPKDLPREHKIGDPYYCYICGSEVGNRGDGENGGRGIFDVAERVYHVVHWRCERHYFQCHRWKGPETLENIHIITRRNYIELHIHQEWVI